MQRSVTGWRKLAGWVTLLGVLWGGWAEAGPLTITPAATRLRIAEGETQTLQFTVGNGTPSARVLSNDPMQEPFVGSYSFAAGDAGNLITGVTVQNLASYRGKTLPALGSDQVSLQVATGSGGGARPVKPQTATWNMNLKGWSRPSTGGTLVEDASPNVTVEVFDLIKGGDISGGIATTDFGPAPSGAGIVSVVEQTLGWSLTLSERRLLYGLGIWDEGNNGLAAAHEVGLWSDVGGGELLAQLTLDNSAQAYASTESTGAWLFQRLPIPIWLDPGNYVLGAHYLSTGTDAFRYSTAQEPLTFTPDPGVSFGASRRVGAGSSQGVGLLYPDAEIPGEVGRFGPNLLLAPVPEPGVVGLCLLAVACGGGRRWLRGSRSTRSGN